MGKENIPLGAISPTNTLIICEENYNAINRAEQAIKNEKNQSNRKFLQKVIRSKPLFILNACKYCVENNLAMPKWLADELLPVIAKYLENKGDVTFEELLKIGRKNFKDSQYNLIGSLAFELIDIHDFGIPNAYDLIRYEVQYAYRGNKDDVGDSLILKCRKAYQDKIFAFKHRDGYGFWIFDVLMYRTDVMKLVCAGCSYDNKKMDDLIANYSFRKQLALWRLKAFREANKSEDGLSQNKLNDIFLSSCELLIRAAEKQ